MTIASMPRSELASHFESLGGGSLNANGWAFGCEFGFFQRHSGIDPLGLLRWASIASQDLLRGLEAGFEHVGDPAHLQMRTHTGWDWGATQTLYGMYLDHTQMARDSVSEHEALEKVSRSLGFLRDRFLQDLQSGDKVFVYRTYDHVLKHAQVLDLARAVRSYGPATLLYVTHATETHPAFTVEDIHPGLMVGYIDRFAPGHGRLDYNDDGWDKVCRAALATRGLTPR